MTDSSSDAGREAEADLAANLNDQNSPDSLLKLGDQDRARLAEALQELLAHGSILGLESGQGQLYTWCRQNFEWLRETAELAGMDVALLHEERMVQAIPRIGSMVLHLRQDATLIWLALWYAADVRWRDEGETQAFLNVAELNALLKDQLLPDAIGQIAKGRQKEILRQAARFNLIRFQAAEPFEESTIEVLPAIRRVVPFRDLADWTESASAFKRDTAESKEGEPSSSDEAPASEEEVAS